MIPPPPSFFSLGEKFQWWSHIGRRRRDRSLFFENLVQFSLDHLTPMIFDLTGINNHFSKKKSWLTYCYQGDRQVLEPYREPDHSWRILGLINSFEKLCMCKMHSQFHGIQGHLLFFSHAATKKLSAEFFGGTYININRSSSRYYSLETLL